MRSAALLFSVSALAAALLASAPAGATTVDASAPIATAAPPSPGAASGDDVDRQIDAWVAASPLRPGDLATPAPAAPEPRAIHGEVTAGIGTHGYREVSGIADIPFGRTGLATVAVSDVQGNGYGYGYGYGRQHAQSLGLTISLGDPNRARGAACGGREQFDSPLWARQFRAEGYGSGEPCAAAPGRGLR